MRETLHIELFQDGPKAWIDYAWIDGTVHLMGVEVSGSSDNILPALSFPVMNRIRQACEEDALRWIEKKEGVA